MSVKQRGKCKVFHYRFNVAGKIHCGVCHGCVTQKEAEEYEKEQRILVADLQKQKSEKALVENYRYTLLGCEPIGLAEAFEQAMAKPSRREPSQEVRDQKKLYWYDFLSYLQVTFPDARNLIDVQTRHCEGYVRYLHDNGRFDKTVSFQVGHGRKARTVTYELKYTKISAKTIKEIAGVCRGVFAKLSRDSGLTHNPWDDVVLPRSEHTPREIFTEEELVLIRKGLSGDAFCKPLFVIAALTGLTEGDICTLKWSEIDWSAKNIHRRRRKTEVWIDIPITDSLERYLRSLHSDNEYVLPEHAELYLRQQSAVSRRIKNFLESLDIVSVVKHPGRRAISIKDLHSMRHVFCYYAGMVGIPIHVVQSIVGHMTPEMTRRYMAHTTEKDRRQAMDKLPAFLHLMDGEVEAVSERKQLSDLAYSLPLETVQEILRIYGESNAKDIKTDSPESISGLSVVGL